MPMVAMYLRQAAGDIHKLHDLKHTIEKAKKKQILKKVFVTQTECENWEEAQEKFPEHTEKVDDFLGNYLLL